MQSAQPNLGRHMHKAPFSETEANIIFTENLRHERMAGRLAPLPTYARVIQGNMAETTR